MEIIFLGTSSGTPTKTRNVSSIVIRKHHAKQWSLIDCGEGTQHQILHTNLSFKYLDTIYITHIHGDHCYGLPGLLASATMAGRIEPLSIVAPLAVKVFLETMQMHTELRLSFDIDFIVVEEYNKLYEREDFCISIVPLSHRVPSWGYLFEEKGIEIKLDTQKLLEDNIPKGVIWGEIQKSSEVCLENGKTIQSKTYYLPQRKARKIAISGDNDTPSIWGNIEDIDLLVHEATYTDEMAKKAEDTRHSTVKQVAMFAEDYGLKNLILTHFSPRYQENMVHSNAVPEIEAEAKKYYHAPLGLAHDFALFHLDKQLKMHYQNVHQD